MEPMVPTAPDVLRAMSGSPAKVGDLGLRVMAAQGVDVRGAQGIAVGEFLARQGLSLSALQKILDALVASGQVRELRGSDLWGSFQEGLGAQAKGRHYVLPSPP